MENGVEYISWVYDSPHLTLDSKTVMNTGNHIFLFDYEQYRRMWKRRGNAKFYYLPLAVNVDRLIQQEKGYKMGYTHEISFVGKLYNGQRDYWTQIQYMPQYLKGFLEGCMEVELHVPGGGECLERRLDKKIVEELAKYVRMDLSEEYFKDDKQLFLNMMLYRHETVLERTRILNAVSEIASTVIYCNTKTPELPKVLNLGWADYWTEMPEIFKRSKVNLNITLRSIRSGIPLRVMDIMGAGGFTLSNFQKDMEEVFEIGQEIVTFESLEESVDKVDYYLRHDDEREQIAARGCRKVREEFNYETQFRKMFGMLGVKM